MRRITIALAIIATSSVAQAETVYYADRAAFDAAVGESVTDGYTAYTPGVYSDAEMSAFLGETRYIATSNADRNSVGDVFLRGDGSNYCAGCNGNFKLVLDATSLSADGGVFGVAVDIVLHTSRYVSIGDDDPNNPTFPGIVLVQFTDGSAQQIAIPPDIGYYESQTYFLGVSDERGIASVTVGTESRPHFWVIDNLTLAADPVQSPSVLLQQLQEDVIGVGPAKLFERTVAQAHAYYAVPDIQATCSVMRFFDFEVRVTWRLSQATRRPAPWKITTDQMDDLLGQSGSIQIAIGCN